VSNKTEPYLKGRSMKTFDEDARRVKHLPVRWASAALVAMAALAALGCASTLGGSHATNATGSGINGVPYRLPRVTMAVALVRSTNGVRVEFTRPIYGPDRDKDGNGSGAYLLQFHPRSSSKDTFNVSVDPATGLLTSVTGEADDQGAKILEELGKLAGALAKPEAAIETGEKQILFEAVFDPGEAKEVDLIEKGLNAALKQPLTNALKEDCDFIVAKGLSAANPKTEEERKKTEKELRRSSSSCVMHGKRSAAKFSPAQIWVEVDYTAFKYSTATPVDCNVGICTRVLSPARLAVGSGDSDAGAGVLHGTAIGARGFSIPNGSAAVPIQLKRAAFAKVNYDIKLKDGLITTSNVTKESEALAIVSAPGKAIDAFFKSLANLVQLKIDLTTKQKELLVAEKDKIAAEKALEDAKKGDAEVEKKQEEAKAESAAEENATTPFLSVEIPGLGIGSGIELVSKGIPYSGGSIKEESAAERRPPDSRKAAPKDEPPSASDVLGGPVEEDDDGSER
jgi:hypothetical protein